MYRVSNSRFRRFAGGVSSLGLHLVWCPNYRHRLLSGRIAIRLDELLDEIAAREVMPDHVHVFVRVRLTGSPAEVVRRFKGRTSRVLRAEFAWPLTMAGPPACVVVEVVFRRQCRICLVADRP